MYQATIEVDGLPLTTNAMNAQGKWTRIKDKRKWHDLIGKYLLLHRLKPSAPLKRARLRLSRFSSKLPDYDGLVGSFKSCVDALVEFDVLEDDSLNHIGMPEFHWEKVRPKLGKIKIEIWEVTQ